ncbi:MAG: glycosyltransferase family 4 protein [Thermodesulfovibrionia bacterium]|nr:glycosyltransferase family 4 protein [Thermodesulfovibrionia bacterium]
MANRKSDILLWVDLAPDKLGSFEQYLLQQVRTCKEHGLEIFAVFKEGISGEILSLMEAEGIRHTSYPFKFMHSPRVLLYEMKRTGCKLVHFHFFSLCSELYWVSKLNGRRTLISSRSSITEQQYNEKPGWLVRYRRRLYSAAIDKVIAVSEFKGWYLKEKDEIPQNKIDVILNGIDTNKYKPIDDREKQLIRQSLGINNDVILVSYTGQLADYKGINDLLSAIEILRETGITIFYLFVGSGPLKDKVISAGENVMVLGKRNDVNKIVAASDIFVAPSTWHEAFGFTIAEASACGVPVVATNVGGIPEIVKQGVSGFIVPVRSPQEISNKIQSLASNKELRINMGNEGRRHAIENFTVERMAIETYQLYRKML